MKQISRLWHGLTTLLVVAAVILAVMLAGLRLAGLAPRYVMSGSMAPTYPAGSLIYVRQVNPSDIQVGDPITFVADASNQVVTHRVVEITAVDAVNTVQLDESGQPVLDEQGNPTYEETRLLTPRYYFTTKGDANQAADAMPVLDRNVLGMPVFAIPYLGYVSAWLQTYRGKVLGAAIVLAILMVTLLPDLLSLLHRWRGKAKKPCDDQHETHENKRTA